MTPFTIGVALLMPPVSLALLALLVLLFWRRHGRIVAILLLVPLVLMALPIVSVTLYAELDTGALPVDAPGLETVDPAPQAIVILSADIERGGSTPITDVGPLTLERERAGAALHRRTGLPILVSGGIVVARPPLGMLMALSLPEDFGVPVRWVESKSSTTWENARLSAPILKEAGITRVYLVTHAWHMRRSLLAFRRAGIDAVPAVVRPLSLPYNAPLEWLPRASSWIRSDFALHEWGGLFWYWIRP